MKLVEIKDVRVGQVRKIIIMDFNAENTKEVIGVFTRANDSDYDMFDWIAEYYDVETKMSLGDYEDWTFEDCGELIGKINITHTIEDNKLVEIPRDEFQFDDVVIELEVDDEDPFILISYNFNKEISSGIGASNVYFPTKRKLQKLGIYGITHEFVNDREVKNEYTHL